jgi:hypothetical protein
MSESAAQIQTPGTAAPAPAGQQAQASTPPSTSTPAPVGPTTEAPPPEAKPDLAAEVMKRRDSSALAKLMREKRELDARAAQLAEKAPVLDGFERARQYAEEGDHARATRAFYETIYGPEKAQEMFPHVYASLTSEVVGVESAAQAQARFQRDLARLQQQQQELQEKVARDQAAHEQWIASTREERITGAVGTIASMLEQSTDYPYLLAESEEPAQVVWEIMVEALERGEQPPTPEEAAKIANNHFQPIFEKKKTRYQHLLAPQGASGSNQPETPASQNGSRKSLTNADAASAPDLRAPPTIMNRDDSIDAAWRLLQERHRQA